jgi:hypothetical protein
VITSVLAGRMESLVDRFGEHRFTGTDQAAEIVDARRGLRNVIHPGQSNVRGMESAGRMKRAACCSTKSILKIASPRSTR